MEIGPLSEWVTAIAEIAAVCVALFLPVYDKKREKKKRTRNLKKVFIFLIQKALDENDTTGLEAYFKISYLTIDSLENREIYAVVQPAFEILKKPDTPKQKKEENLKPILEYLNQK